MKLDRCVALHQINSYLNLTEDRKPHSQQSPSWEGLYKPIRVLFGNSYMLEALQGDCRQEHLMADT